MKEEDQKPEELLEKVPSKLKAIDDLGFQIKKVVIRDCENNLPMLHLIFENTEVENLIKQFLSEKIETFGKSFIKTLDDRKDKIYKEAKKTTDKMMISNLSGEVNAIFWMRKELIERVNDLEKDLGVDK